MNTVEMVLETYFQFKLFEADFALKIRFGFDRVAFHMSDEARFGADFVNSWA